MAAGLPPDSQAAMASSCGDAAPEALPAGAAAAALARARARLRAALRRATAFSCFTSRTALWRFRRVSVWISCFEAAEPAAGVAALVSLSVVAAKATAGTAAAEAASAGTRTFLTESLLRRVRCALLAPPPPRKGGGFPPPQAGGRTGAPQRQGPVRDASNLTALTASPVTL